MRSWRLPVVVFTDGVVEARNRSGAFFEETRFQEVIRDNAHLDPPDLVDTIFRSLDQWADGADQSDDITVVVLAAPEAAAETGGAGS